MYTLPKYVAVLIVLHLLAACANFNTLERRTSTPNSGKAIHLDVQQRLVLFDALGRVCAEPSPDAMASFASSMGVSMSDLSGTSKSISQSGGSTAASIGLRTQSITLMRDTLYRMCEAYLNNAVNPVQLATFLSKSQDLIAVLLATEQLTGAVKANQVIVHQSGDASALGSLLSSQSVLDQAKTIEQEKKAKLDALKADHAVIQQENTQSKANYDAAKSTYDAYAVSTKPEATTLSQYKSAMDAKKLDLDNATGKLDIANQAIKAAEVSLEDSKKITAILEANKDSALTRTSASFGGGGQFVESTNEKPLSEQATQIIASTVGDMVSAVLTKSYTDEFCKDFLVGGGLNIKILPDTDPKLKEQMQQQNLDIARTCLNIVSKQSKVELEKLGDKYGNDISVEQLDEFLADKNNQSKFDAYMDMYFPTLNKAEVLTLEKYEHLRKLLLDTFKNGEVKP